MVGLLSLPDELLTMIANELRNDPTRRAANTQIDLLNLALTCSSLTGSVYEILYSCPRLLEPQTDDSRFSGALLARTLLSRPELMDRVQDLRISITGASKVVTHTEECDWSEFGEIDVCHCGWLEVAHRFKDAISASRLYGHPGPTSYKWMRGIRHGKELPILGMLLACLPNLKHLSLEDCGTATGNNLRLRSLEVDMWKVFGLIEAYDQVAWHPVPGLTKLQALKIDRLPPPSLLCLPSLTSLSFIADSWSVIQSIPVFSFHDIDETRVPTAPLSCSVRKVTMRTDIHWLYAKYRAEEDAQAAYILQQLSNMSSLVIEIGWPQSYFNNSIISDDGYGHAVDKLNCPNLRELTIDITRLHTQVRAYNRSFFPLHLPIPAEILRGEFDAFSVDDMDPRQVWLLSPAASLAKFGSLTRLVAPMGLFLALKPGFRFCELPLTIEHIGIFDVSNMIHVWAESILQNMEMHQSLSVIELWQCREDDSKFFLNDIRLSVEFYEEYVLEDSAWLDMVAKCLKVDPEVWDKMKDHGITVNFLCSDGTPWKKV